MRGIRFLAPVEVRDSRTSWSNRFSVVVAGKTVDIPVIACIGVGVVVVGDLVESVVLVVVVVVVVVVGVVKVVSKTASFSVVDNTLFSFSCSCSGNEDGTVAGNSSGVIVDGVVIDNT